VTKAIKIIIYISALGFLQQVFTAYEETVTFQWRSPHKKTAGDGT
jgi:hypothetical protein